MIINKKIILKVEENFETILWKKVNELLNSNQEVLALLYLYESLIDELENPEKCDSFLKQQLNVPL